MATVLVLGASGALVTATAANGLTTVTITQPSTTTATETTTTNTTTTNPAILALFNRTSAEQDPTGTATGNGCSDAAHIMNGPVQFVDAASKTHREDVKALGKAAEKTDENQKRVKDADTKIKDLRQETVKTIHGLFKSDECKGNADEDNDDEDAATGTGATTSTTTTTTVAISCTDAKACADAAVAEMDKVVADLKTALGAPAAAPATTNTGPGKSDKANRDNHDSKGKGRG